jgi:spermidine synthase
MRLGQQKITHFFEGIGVSLGRLELVDRRKGVFRQIRLFRHPELGKIFVLGNEIQHVEAWAPLYHEPLVHLSASFVKETKDVLILGGGTLFAASEALKYKSVKQVVLLDHDPQVIEMAVKHYPHAKKCFNDPRFKFVNGDAYTSVSNIGQKFDMVINDGLDLLEIKPRVRQGRIIDPFLLLTMLLKPNGVCADVVFRHVLERRRTLQTLGRLRHRFRLALALILLPEYHGVLHVLCMWGKRSSSVTQGLNRPKNMEQLSWMRKPAGSPCEYYDSRFLDYYLYLPRYIRNALAIKKNVV